MAAQTTSGLSNEMKTYYESTFLKTGQYVLRHGEGAQKNTHPKGEGKKIRFNRYQPLAPATTPLTEGSNPAESNLTSTIVEATLAEYGNTVKISKLLKLTSIDKEAAHKVELLGQNMGETLDTLAREELFTGATVQLANGRSTLAQITTGDNLTATEVRKAKRQLEKNLAIPYKDGFFLGKIGPDTNFDLINDSVWVNAKTYSDTKDLYKGETGELYGIRFLNVTKQKTETSTVDVYSNFIHGRDAFGEYDLSGDIPRLYIKNPSEGDTSNPADRYSTISWAGAYVAKVLVAEWIINIKTAASA